MFFIGAIPIMTTFFTFLVYIALKHEPVILSPFWSQSEHFQGCFPPSRSFLVLLHAGRFVIS
jgi:hypothetical protein